MRALKSLSKVGLLPCSRLGSRRFVSMSCRLYVWAEYKIIWATWRYIKLSCTSGVTADLDTPWIWIPAPNPLVDMDPPPHANSDPPPTKLFPSVMSLLSCLVMQIFSNASLILDTGVWLKCEQDKTSYNWAKISYILLYFSLTLWFLSGVKVFFSHFCFRCHLKKGNKLISSNDVVEMVHFKVTPNLRSYMYIGELVFFKEN